MKRQAETVRDFRIPPEPKLCGPVREQVLAFARSCGVHDDDLEQFSTALGEAVANAIEHAQSGPIEIECRIGRDKIVASIVDSGLGFAVQPHITDELPGFDAERGRGLPIMRRCSDIFAVHTAPGAGTEVVLGRFLRRPLGDVAERTA